MKEDSEVEPWAVLDALNFCVEFDLTAAHSLSFYRPVVEVHDHRSARRAARNQKFRPTWDS